MNDSHHNRLMQALKRIGVNRADESAWRDLFGMAWPRVMAHAYRRCRGYGNLAEDVSQEVFLRLLRYSDLTQFRTPDEFYRYLTTVTSNAATDLLRTRKDELSLDMFDEVVPEALSVKAESFNTADQRDVLAKLVEKLKPEDRQLVAMLGQGFTLEEIGDRLGLSYSNTGVRIHRIRGVLGKLLIRMNK